MPKFSLTLATALTIGTLLGGCNSDEEAIKNAENEVFAIHDEVMPKMDDLMKLRKQLNKQISLIDSLKATGSAAATLRNDEEKEQAIRLRRNLNESDSLMNYWMDHYKGDTLVKLSHEDALRYLAEQKDRITDVKTKYNASLEQAREFLDKK
ncbi:viral A-type inclusion protein [Spirosoma fluminis]